MLRFYPAHFVYMNYTIAETLICLLLTLIFYFLARYENTGRMIFAVMTCVFSLALMFTHFRTIGVAISTVLMVVAIRMKKSGKEVSVRYVSVILLILVICVVAVAISPLRSGYKYLDDQLGRLQRLFTAEGLSDIIMGTIGKIFYVCVSTFGLFFLCVVRIWKRRKRCYGLVAFLISLTVSILISAVFFVGGKGIDYLVYGRYTEIFAPIIVCLGLCELRNMMIIQTDGIGFDNACEDEKYTGYGIICSVIMAFAAILLVIYAAIREMNVYMNDFIIGLAWPFGRSNPKVNQLLGIPALLTTAVLWVIIWIAKKRSAENSNDTRNTGKIADKVKNTCGHHKKYTHLLCDHQTAAA